MIESLSSLGYFRFKSILSAFIVYDPVRVCSHEDITPKPKQIRRMTASAPGKMNCRRYLYSINFSSAHSFKIVQTLKSSSFPKTFKSFYITFSSHFPCTPFPEPPVKWKHFLLQSFSQ